MTTVTGTVCHRYCDISFVGCDGGESCEVLSFCLLGLFFFLSSLRYCVITSGTRFPEDGTLYIAGIVDPLLCRARGLCVFIR